MVVISLGWGVQSWTLAAMSALGYLPKVDAAIHSDTTHERERTYEFAKQWTPWLEERGVRVVTVKSHDTGVLRQDSAFQLPAFSYNGDKRSRIRRQCTNHWKIRPLRKWLQKNRQHKPVDVWLGITVDEFTRAKDSGVKYITNKYPLLEMGFSRQGCLDWLADHNLPSPGKSSCVFCPFLNKAAWEDMRREAGADWTKAVAVDEMIREAKPPGELFLHSKRVPLPQAVKDTSLQPSLLELLDSDDADAECDSGHCFL